MKTIFLSVDTFSGDTLILRKLDRKQMGAYLCIASNDVPPAVSKRILLNVQCKYQRLKKYTVKPQQLKTVRVMDYKFIIITRIMKTSRYQSGPRF